MSNKIIRGKKGILMSLLVIVLFVLMLGEVMTYVLININYSLIAQSASLSSVQGTQAATLTLGAASFLHASLSAAVYTLAAYEGHPDLRGPVFINNTKYALTSLIMNGTLNGVNLTDYMGNLTIQSFNGTEGAEFLGEGLNLTLNPGSNLTVFQSSPSVINATYSVLATVNAVGSSYTIPITVTTGLKLNQTADISSPLKLSSGPISISSNLSTATQITGTNAISGSTGPFSFVYGTIVFLGAAPTCSKVPVGELTANYILVAANVAKIPSNVCGMGGLITNSPIPGATTNTMGYNVPYLVYANSLNILGSTFTNGTQELLDGPALSAYSLYPLQSAIQDDQYFTSPYLPNYLDGGQGVLTSRASGGLFSFGQENRVVTDFSTSLLSGSTPGPCVYNGLAIHCYGGSNAISTPANIVVAAGNVVLNPTFTVEFWVDPYSSVSHSQIIGEPTNTEFDINIQTLNTFGSNGGQSDLLSMDYRDSGGTLHTAIYNSFVPIQPNTWTDVALVFGTNSLVWYINGAPSATYTGIPNPAKNTNSFIIGGTSSVFSGMITDVQVYSLPLSPFQVQTLYRGGISAWPSSPVSANLIAWYPLNGNNNDYSGNNYNGTSSYTTFSLLRNYYGDPIYQSAFTNFNTSEVEGVLNCANINQCTQSSQHLYIGSMPLEINSTTLGVVNETAAFGLSGALIPPVLSFTPSPFTGGSYVQEKSPLSWLANGLQPYSMSVWVYPTFANGIVLDERNASGSIDNPFISIQGGTGYIGYRGTTQQCSSIGSIPLNTWSNIALTFNGASDALTGYVNGVSTFSATTQARNSLTYNAFYDLGRASSSGSACGGGPALAFSGLMSDFQAYNVVLSPAQVTTLYLNDSVNIVPTATPRLSMRLNVPYGNLNNTLESISNNYGIFYSSSGSVCTIASVSNGICGLNYAPP